MNSNLKVSYSANENLGNDILSQILELNQNNIPALGGIIDLSALSILYQQSKFCIYKISEGQLVAFALIMDHSSNYQSPNYLYFKNKYREFMYIDRIAVSATYQRMGIGHTIYQELFTRTSKLSIPLCCEVNTLPVNQPSLDFHKKNLFQTIEEISFGKKKVAMLVKPSP